MKRVSMYCWAPPTAPRCLRCWTRSQESFEQHVIPGWSEGPDPESRDSPMCNCTSEVRANARPGANPHPEERPVGRVSEDGPPGLMVRDARKRAPHHEGHHAPSTKITLI